MDTHSNFYETVLGKLAEIDDKLDTASPDRSELFTALAKAHLEIRNAEKDANNPHYKSDYATLASVLSALRQPFAKNGLALIQLPMPAQSTGELRLKTVLTHESGQFIESEWSQYPPKTDPQGFGSCLTYMRKQAAAAFGGIAQVDDDAEATRRDPGDYDRITPKEADTILVQAENLFADEADTVLSRMLGKVFSTSDVPVNEVRDIPAGQAEQAINLLKNQAKRENAKKAKEEDKE